jgi:uncharacterized membrane protein YgcG
VFDSDQNRYRSARAALGISKLTDTSMHQLDDTHLGVLDLDQVASVVGLAATDVKRAIDASPQAFPPEIVTLRTKGGGIQRDALEAIMADLIRALGLGQQLKVDRQGRPAAGGAAAGSGNSNTGNHAANGGAGGASAAAGSGGASGAGGRSSGDVRRR